MTISASLESRVRRASGLEGALISEEELTLARGRGVSVAKALAGNASTGLEASLVLAAHTDSRVRRTLAATTRHIKVKELLLEDPDSVVVECALTYSTGPGHRAFLRRAAASLEARVRRILAKGVTAAPDVECMLARDTDQDVRRALARSNKTSSLKALLLLATDESSHVRVDLVRRRAPLPLEVLKVLVEDQEYAVAVALVMRDDALDPRLDLGFLRSHYRGQFLINAVLEGTDPEVRQALEPGWNGSLDDLASALEDFAPAAPVSPVP